MTEHPLRVFLIQYPGKVINFPIVWALKELCPGARVTLFTVERYQLPIAEAIGADRVW